MEIETMQNKSTYLFNNIKYSIISKNDIDLRVGVRKINNLLKDYRENKIDEILLRSDSKRTIYFYNKDITGKQRPIEFLKEVHSKFDNYSVFINLDVREDCNDYDVLSEKYEDLIGFFQEHKGLRLGMNGTTVESEQDESVTIFVAV